jgi:hypothetical protein
VASSFDRQNAVVMGGSEEFNTALLARRRRSILRRCLLGVLLTVTGFSMVMDDEPKLLWCIITLFFCICTVCSAGLLLLPPEDLLEFPESYFWWIAPSDSETQADSSRVADTANSSTARPEPLGKYTGVWDHDLDGGL